MPYSNNPLQNCSVQYLSVVETAQYLPGDDASVRTCHICKILIVGRTGLQYVCKSVYQFCFKSRNSNVIKRCRYDNRRLMDIPLWHPLKHHVDLAIMDGRDTQFVATCSPI